MRTLLKILLAILAVLVAMAIFSSCSSTKEQRIQNRRLKHCAEANAKWGCNPIIAQDTNTNSNITYKDTTLFVYLPGKVIHDTVHLSGNYPVSLKKRTIKGTYASATVWVTDNVLYIELVQKDTLVARLIKNAIKENSTTTTINTTTKVPYPVITNELKDWQKLFIWIVWFILASTLLYVAYRIVKRFYLPRLP